MNKAKKNSQTRVIAAIVAGVLVCAAGGWFAVVSPKRHAAADKAKSVATDEVEVGIASELLGEGDLVAPGTPGVLDHCLIAHRTVEVAVWLCLGLITSGHILAAETLPY